MKENEEVRAVTFRIAIDLGELYKWGAEQPGAGEILFKLEEDLPYTEMLFSKNEDDVWTVQVTPNIELEHESFDVLLQSVKDWLEEQPYILPHLTYMIEDK